MALIKKIRNANQSITSSRIKKSIFILCILICIFSFIIYSNTTKSTASSQIKLQNLKKKVIKYSSVNRTWSRSNVNRSVLPPYRNRRFAVFACSIHATTLAYTFYIPITAASWKRIGYEPIVIFVGDFLKPNVLTTRLNLSRNYLKQVGAHIIDLQCNESYSIKVSQLVRVFSGFLPDDIVQDDDNILTSDSDLIPLNASEYQPTFDTEGFIFNAFCCGPFERRGRNYTMVPMGHIFLQKIAWRAMIMESKQRAELLVNASEHAKQLLSEDTSLSFDMITLYGRHEFQNVYDQRMDKGDDAWAMDQVLCTMLITDYEEKHPDFNVSRRGRAGRLDRADPISVWDQDKFEQYGDAHLKHDEILEEGNWKIFNRLLKYLFNETLVTLFNEYHKQYMTVDKAP